MSRTRGILAGIGYATIFGFSFLVTKTTLGVLSPLQLLAARFMLAALAMSVLAGLGIIRLSYRGKNLWLLGLMCLFQPVAYFLFETYGVANAATSVAGIILGALPACVALMGALILHERTTRMQSIGLALSVLGVVLVVTWKSQGDTMGETRPIGVLLLTASMLSAVLFNIASRKAAAAFSPAERTFAMMWSGALSFGAAALIESLGKSEQAHAGGLTSGMLMEALPGVLYLGLLSSVVAFFLINYSLTHLKASQSAVFANMTTVLTVAAGVVLRGEQFEPVQALGTILIIGGIGIANSSGARASASSGS
ncbi:MAG: DMT family transporter [Spirochaetales bacterium]|nr:DMT family transporter [Spirochaetales bacterium]